MFLEVNEEVRRDCTVVRVGVSPGVPGVKTTMDRPAGAGSIETVATRGHNCH